MNIKNKILLIVGFFLSFPLCAMTLSINNDSGHVILSRSQTTKKNADLVRLFVRSELSQRAYGFSSMSKSDQVLVDWWFEHQNTNAAYLAKQLDAYEKDAFISEEAKKEKHEILIRMHDSLVENTFKDVADALKAEFCSVWNHAKRQSMYDQADIDLLYTIQKFQSELSDNKKKTFTPLCDELYGKILKKKDITCCKLEKQIEEICCSQNIALSDY